jgi:hypothetical protein
MRILHPFFMLVCESFAPPQTQPLQGPGFSPARGLKAGGYRVFPVSFLRPPALNRLFIAPSV